MNTLDEPAVFSPDRVYRYVLRRQTGMGARGRCLFVMLNPSTADEEKNDPTIRRCIDFANRWGYGWLSVCNLYAFRATNPWQLLVVADPVGPENDRHIFEEIQRSQRVIVAWGEHGHRAPDFYTAYLRHDDVWPRLMCLGVNRGGQPKHPLYVPASTAPITWPRNRNAPHQ